MINYPEIAQAIWKRQYETDFALLDTPQEQIEFLKDLLLKNKENIIETEKLPQFEPSVVQLTNQIDDEFAPYKPTKKEWMKRWDELNKELSPVRLNQTKLSSLEDLNDYIINELKIARRRLEILSDPAKVEVQKIPKDLSSENSHKRKPHTFFIGRQKNLRIPKGKAWINFKSLASESKGEKEIEIHEFGKIYLKRYSSDIDNIVLWSPIKFESSKDGIHISKTAFDKAYDRHNTDI